MTVRPILFSAPMVRALLAGTKTQTRRRLNPQPSDDIDNAGDGETIIDMATGKEIRLRFAEGDRLYVRESWRVSPDAAEGWHPEINRGWIDYQAGGSAEMTAPSADAVDRATFLKTEEIDWDCVPSRYRPGIHMPRWASRLTLTVTEARIERLHDINEADATAEGTQEPSLRELRGDLTQAAWSERQVYARLWDHINGAGAWESNPWVSVTSFTVEQRNIDNG